MDGIIANDRRAHPLRPLFHLGERFARESPWPDYPTEFDLGPEHIDPLIAVACDPELLDDDCDEAAWAPVHAWRALGQLRAASFIRPLLNLLRTRDDDFLLIEAPIVLGMIGPVAIPALSAFIANRSNPDLSIGNALAGLQHIASRHPQCRDECIDTILQSLRDPDTDRVVNGFAVSSLLDLHVMEAIGPIRDAFRRGAVDISIAGDLEDVEIAFGVRSHRDTPAPNYLEAEGWSLPPPRREKIGRNEPCPCGSGRKYKKCCLH